MKTGIKTLWESKMGAEAVSLGIFYVRRRRLRSPSVTVSTVAIRFARQKFANRSPLGKTTRRHWRLTFMARAMRLWVSHKRSDSRTFKRSASLPVIFEQISVKVSEIKSSCRTRSPPSGKEHLGPKTSIFHGDTAPAIVQNYGTSEALNPLVHHHSRIISYSGKKCQAFRGWRINENLKRLSNLCGYDTHSALVSNSLAAAKATKHTNITNQAHVVDTWLRFGQWNWSQGSTNHSTTITAEKHSHIFTC